MASRTLLGKLEARGQIQLPPRRRVPANRICRTPVAPIEWDQSVLRTTPNELGALQVAEVSRDRSHRQQVASALSQFHYLGFKGTVGENLQYTVRTRSGRWLGCLVFGSAAWKCRDRDTFIGWDISQRQRNLSRLTNNSRFLILPGVQVPHLASWILAAVTRRLSADWQSKYGHPIDLLETFVELARFQGTAYRAANWCCVGQTTGRTRQDRARLIQAQPKSIYLYPLHPQFRQRLCQ